eukprot:7866949-Pyramimonas_sp.AAC.1
MKAQVAIVIVFVCIGSTWLAISSWYTNPVASLHTTNAAPPSCDHGGQRQFDERTNFTKERLSFVNNVVKRVMQKHNRLTMVSTPRILNVRDAALDVIRRGIPGDFVETGTWKGGCSIVMRAVNLVFGDITCRGNWLFDTFNGLPRHTIKDLDVDTLGPGGALRKMDPEGSYRFEGGVDTVKRHFISLLGDGFMNLHFQVGVFKDTLHAANIDKISVLRLDGDMYSSTMDVLQTLYDRVESGGYVIIDDYGHWPQCKKAVHDFFDVQRNMDIHTLLRKVDYTAYFFIKP